MKTKMWLSIFIMSSLLMSCKGEVTEQRISLEVSDKTVAETYVSNIMNRMVIIDKARSIESDYPSYFYEIEIEKNDGTKITFDELTDLEKANFVEGWLHDYTEELDEKLAGDKDFQNYMQIQNEAFLLTDEEYYDEKNDRDYDELLFENLCKLIKQQSARKSRSSSSSSSSSDDESNMVAVSKDSVNKNTLKILKDYYKKGRIVINHGSEGSSWNLGHVSMLSANEYSDLWEKEGLQRVSISSFPGNGHQKVTWPDQSDGVQYEPVAYWCGKNAARNVKIYYVKNKTTNKDGRSTNDEISDDYYNKALEFAISKLGKPYPPYEGGITQYDFIKYKESDDYYYCSSLVRSAWIYVDKKISMGIYPWVAPGDIGSSTFTKKIGEWSNY